MRYLLTAMLLLGLLSLPAAAEEAHFPQLKLENYLRAAELGEDAPILANRYPLGDPVVSSDSTIAFGGALTAFPARFYGLERYELTRFDTALGGMGTGATAGLFLGALGTTTGLFGEDAAWYLAGGMAALGAVLGATRGYGDRSSRIRYRWSQPLQAPPEHEGADALHPQNER